MDILPCSRHSLSRVEVRYLTGRVNDSAFGWSGRSEAFFRFKRLSAEDEAEFRFYTTGIIKNRFCYGMMQASPEEGSRNDVPEPSDAYSDDRPDADADLCFVMCAWNDRDRMDRLYQSIAGSDCPYAICSFLRERVFCLLP